MRAVLYIHQQTFNLADKPNDEITEYLKQFADMIHKVKDRDGKGIHTDFVARKKNMINRQWVYRGITMREILEDSTGTSTPCPLGVIQLLRRAILNNVLDVKSIPQQAAHLRRATKNERHGICVANRLERYKNLPQVVSNYREVVEFRLNHYFDFPDSDAYFDECDCFLDKLSLHPDIKDHYKQRFKTHHRQIHEGLLALNFHYLEDMREYEGDYRKFYKPFSHKYGFDNGSGEGNPEMMRKHKVSFDDRADGVIPDPHLKFNSADNGSHCIARIYFETPTISSSKIYITHILQHLKDRGKMSL